MDLIEPDKTELCFITATDISTRTFFAQLCKNPNEDLIKFNLAVGDYCCKVRSEKTECKSKKVHKGDTVCARYVKDDTWFRAMVIGSDKSTGMYRVFFTDFGNVETVTEQDIIVPDIQELPDISRAPFGITCFLENSESFSEVQIAHFLRSVYDNYVMIKVLERQTKLQWKVRIPKHAYNIPFWLIYKPEKAAGEPAAAAGPNGEPGQVEYAKKIEAGQDGEGEV